MKTKELESLIDQWIDEVQEQVLLFLLVLLALVVVFLEQIFGRKK